MDVKVVTFNLRMDTTGDGKYYFFNRAPYILRKIQNENPDIICFQEATDKILDWLKCNLYQYTVVGTGRGKDLRDEANPIAFRKDKFELFTLDQFWLSLTPHIPGSRHKGQSDCPRICMVASLRVKGSPQLLRIYNTHLDHVGMEARVLGIRSILERITSDNQALKCPIILTGDFNAEPTEETIKEVKKYSDFPLLDATDHILTTFHDFGKLKEPSGNKIDYIFSDMTVACSAEIWEQEDGYFLTDHYPISVTFSM
jgi:endonuclease/exonuclease/phosphatase family metal-dependent hydrolase